jgi:hypothetical protein
MAKNKITARLGKRQAFWDPGIPGVTPLNGIGQDGPIELTVSEDENPTLYVAVIRAIKLGVLVAPLDENDTGKREIKTEKSDDSNTKKEYPSIDNVAKELLSVLDTNELINKLSTIVEVGLLSTLMEYEINGENRTGKPRDKVKAAIRSRIKEIEQPNE